MKTTMPLSLGLILLLFPALQAEEPAPNPLWMFVGTYSGPKSKGIYRYQFNPQSGEISNGELAAEVVNPSFLAIHPSGRFLYCVNEGGMIGGKKTGGVTAFELDPTSGSLKKLNEQASVGAGPCHVTVDPAGKNLLIANYGGGTTNLFPLGSDGRIKDVASVMVHKAPQNDPKKKIIPRAHSVNVSKDNRFAIVADLGLDEVLVYQLDEATGTLKPNSPPFLAMAPGAGPRHFAFHPDGKSAFIINETDSTLSSLSYDADKGVLTRLDTVSTLPNEAARKGNSTAEVVVHPSGHFVYGSNRGHDSIVGFRIGTHGKLTRIGHATEGVKEPRNFNIDPAGNFLVVGSQNGHKIVVFKIDTKTGALSATKHSVEIGSPVCIKFWPKSK